MLRKDHECLTRREKSDQLEKEPSVDRRDKPALAEQILNRFKNIRIVAYAIVAGTLLVAFTTLFETVSKLRALIPVERNVANYDSKTEESAFQVARLIDDFFSRVTDSTANQSSFEVFREDYRRIEIEIRQLQLRNSARPLNRISEAQSALLLGMWQGLKIHHQEDGTLSPKFATEKHEQLTEVISRILEWEEEKPKPNGP
jgi:hypothetical protein